MTTRMISSGAAEAAGWGHLPRDNVVVPGGRFSLPALEKDIELMSDRDGFFLLLFLKLT